MKKLYSLIITLLLVILGTNSAFAIEKKNITLEQNPSISNTLENINQAKIIEEEVEQFKNNLEKLEKKYLLENDEAVKNALSDINEIIYILRKIQTTKVNKATADSVIKIVLSDLKQINTSVKSYLRNIQENIKIQIIKIESLSLLISEKLDEVITIFTKHYSKKEHLSESDSTILRKLIVLKIYSKQLKQLPEKDFTNFQDARGALLEIIGPVKKVMVDIRKQL